MDSKGFFTCFEKKNRPKVTLKICKNCKLRKTCSQYQDYLQPSLFDNNFLPKKSERINKRNRTKK
jgi:hypothetical protein